MSRYSYPTNGTVRSFELVKAISEAISSVSSITQRISEIYRHRIPATYPSSFVLVRELQPLGGRVMGAHGQQVVRIQVQVFTLTTRDYVDEFHAAIQDDVAERLLSPDWNPAFSHVTVTNPLHQTREAEQPIAYPGMDRLVSTSEYAIAVIPKT